MLMSQLYHCFDTQLKLIRQYTYDRVVSDIKKLQQKPIEEIADQLSTIHKAMLDQSMKSFERKAQSLIIQDSGWDQKVALHCNDLKS